MHLYLNIWEHKTVAHVFFLTPIFTYYLGQGGFVFTPSVCLQDYTKTHWNFPKDTWWKDVSQRREYLFTSRWVNIAR